MTALKFDAETFQKLVYESDDGKPVLVQFTASWCGPCKAMAPFVEQLANDYSDRAVVGKVDIDDHPELAQCFQVRGVPTFVVLKDAQVVTTAVGGQTKKALSELLEKAITP